MGRRSGSRRALEAVGPPVVADEEPAPVKKKPKKTAETE